MSAKGVLIDIANFLADHKLMQHMYRTGTIPFSKVALLASQLLGPRDDMPVGYDKRMNREVHSAVNTIASERSDFHSLRITEKEFEVELLPAVLNLLVADLKLTNEEMDGIYEKLGAPTAPTTDTVDGSGKQLERGAGAFPRKSRVGRQSFGTRSGSSNSVARTLSFATPVKGDSADGATQDSQPSSAIAPVDASYLVASPFMASPSASGMLVPSRASPHIADHGAMVAQLRQRDAEIEELKEQLRRTQRSRRYWMERAEATQVALEDMCADYGALKATTDFRPSRCITTVGGYTLAIRRNIAHASAKATAEMVTGTDAAPGSGGRVQDPHTVVSYEHRASIAKALRSRDFYSRPTAEEAANQVEVHLLKCDGTHSQAIEKSKVHVSAVHSSVFNIAAVGESCPEHSILESLGREVECLSTMGDLVKCGTEAGGETYGFMLRHLASVGCPTWQQQAALPQGEQCHCAVYLFGVDAGPGNIGALPKLQGELAHCPYVMYAAVFCFCHQVHLICKDLLQCMEGWQWGVLTGTKQYWGTVATVANVWRSCGIPTRLYEAAVEVPGGGPLAAQRMFKQIPGRPLRGRWGSVASVEKTIMNAFSLIGAVFAKAFGKDEAGVAPAPAKKAKAKAKPPKKKKLGDDEDKEYKQQQGPPPKPDPPPDPQRTARF